MKKDVRVFDKDGSELRGEDISPLTLLVVVLSVSALCNAQSRWLFAHLDNLKEYGGYAAANDLRLVADALVAMAEDNLEGWKKIHVAMPPGFAHAPWSAKTATGDEKGDLPF